MNKDNFHKNIQPNTQVIPFSMSFYLTHRFPSHPVQVVRDGGDWDRGMVAETKAALLSKT